MLHLQFEGWKFKGSFESRIFIYALVLAKHSIIHVGNVNA